MSKLLFGRRVQFNAFHHYRLPSMSDTENQRLFGEAAQPHNHLWTLTIWLSGEPDPQTGMIANLDQVDRILKEQVVDPLEGKDINRAFPLKQPPTTETLALFFAERLRPQLEPIRLAKLRIAESDFIFSEWIA